MSDYFATDDLLSQVEEDRVYSAVIPSAPSLWIIIDRQTGAQVGKPYTNRVRASRRVDRLDNEYGAYRYSVRPL